MYREVTAEMLKWRRGRFFSRIDLKVVLFENAKCHEKERFCDTLYLSRVHLGKCRLWR